MTLPSSARRASAPPSCAPAARAPRRQRHRAVVHAQPGARRPLGAHQRAPARCAGRARERRRARLAPPLRCRSGRTNSRPAGRPAVRTASKLIFGLTSSSRRCRAASRLRIGPTKTDVLRAGRAQLAHPGRSAEHAGQRTLGRLRRRRVLSSGPISRHAKAQRLQRAQTAGISAALAGAAAGAGRARQRRPDGAACRSATPRPQLAASARAARSAGPAAPDGRARARGWRQADGARSARAATLQSRGWPAMQRQRTSAEASSVNLRAAHCGASRSERPGAAHRHQAAGTADPGRRTLTSPLEMSCAAARRRRARAARRWRRCPRPRPRAGCRRAGRARAPAGRAAGRAARRRWQRRQSLRARTAGRAHQRQRDAVQHRRRVDLGVDLLQAGKATRQRAQRARLAAAAARSGRRRSRPCAAGRRPRSRSARRRACGRGRGAVATATGRSATSGRCAAPRAPARRVERVGQGHADGQRQARPVARRQRQASEKVSDAPAAGLPAAAQAAAAARSGARPPAGRAACRRCAGRWRARCRQRRRRRIGVELAGRGHRRVAPPAAERAHARAARVLVDSARATHLDATGPAAAARAAATAPRRPSAGATRPWRRSRRSDARLLRSSAGAPQRLGASIVPRQRGAPQRQAYSLLQLRRVALVDHQAVVVEQLFAGRDVAQGLDEDAAVVLVGLAVGLAGVVDPARRVAADLGVDDMLVVDVEVEGVVRVARVVRVAAQRLASR